MSGVFYHPALQGPTPMTTNPRALLETDARRLYEHLSDRAAIGSPLRSALKTASCYLYPSYLELMQKTREILENMLLEFEEGKHHLDAITSRYASPTLDYRFFLDLDVVLDQIVSEYALNKFRQKNTAKTKVQRLVLDRCAVPLRFIPLRHPVFQNLHVLNLSNNKLTELPHSLFLLQELKVLDISNNRLTYIDRLIENLKSLETLHATQNELRAIPSTLNRLYSLLVLKLGNNQLNDFPLDLSDCRELVTIDLSGNRLSQLLFRCSNKTRQLFFSRNPWERGQPRIVDRPQNCSVDLDAHDDKRERSPSRREEPPKRYRPDRAAT